MFQATPKKMKTPKTATKIPQTSKTPARATPMRKTVAATPQVQSPAAAKTPSPVKAPVEGIKYHDFKGNQIK
jgi:hypothetical protein